MQSQHDVRHKIGQAVLLPAAVALLGLASAGANAAVTLVTSPGSLVIADTVDWSVLGPAFTNLSNPFTINSANSNLLTVSQAGGNATRVDQGLGWNGNFTSGDELIWTQAGGGPLTIGFSTPVSGAGAQIQADFFGGFTARLTAFDSSNNNIGSVTENGTSDSNGDGSAIFLGLTSDIPIASLVFSLDSAAVDTTDFAINKLDIGPAGTPATPEPGNIALLLVSGLGGAGLLLRRRKK